MRERKRERVYCRSEGRHEASVVEFIIVPLLWNPLGIENAASPQLILSICHGKRGKHKLRRIKRDLRYVLTHQLAAYPFCQVINPQTSTLERLGDLKNDDGSSLLVWVHNSRSTYPQTPNDLWPRIKLEGSTRKMQEKATKDNGCLTYLLRRKSVKVLSEEKLLRSTSTSRAISSYFTA